MWRWHETLLWTLYNKLITYTWISHAQLRLVINALLNIDLPTYLIKQSSVEHQIKLIFSFFSLYEQYIIQIRAFWTVYILILALFVWLSFIILDKMVHIFDVRFCLPPQNNKEEKENLWTSNNSICVVFENSKDCQKSFLKEMNPKKKQNVKKLNVHY